MTCVCCKDNVEECCGAKVSYVDEITKFKLVSDQSDMDIKEDTLGLESSTLEEIVKMWRQNKALRRRTGHWAKESSAGSASWSLGRLVLNVAARSTVTQKKTGQENVPGGQSSVPFATRPVTLHKCARRSPQQER